MRQRSSLSGVPCSRISPRCWPANCVQLEIPFWAWAIPPTWGCLGTAQQVLPRLFTVGGSSEKTGWYSHVPPPPAVCLPIEPGDGRFMQAAARITWPSVVGCGRQVAQWVEGRQGWLPWALLPIHKAAACWSAGQTLGDSAAALSVAGLARSANNQRRQTPEMPTNATGCRAQSPSGWSNHQICCSRSGARGQHGVFA